jgi:hypothetical protein
VSDVYHDAYWQDEFDITLADLDRIAARMRETGTAFDLGELAKRVVGGRLRYGPESSRAALPTWAADPSIRLWDPAGNWANGDQVIVWTYVFRLRRNEVLAGKISRLDAGCAYITVDDSYQPERKFLIASPGSSNAIKWHATVQQAVEELSQSATAQDRASAVLLKHGERVLSRLDEALQTDNRYVNLDRRWFLRELAAPLAEHQIVALAWAMLHYGTPQATDALVPLVRPPLVAGDPGLFGLHLTMCDRADLFERLDGEHCLWTLASPPPGPCTAAHAAYDPQTYEILCDVNEMLEPAVVQRLWELGLLPAVVSQ